MEALRSATTTPAAYFKQETKFGSVEPGQTADLVLLDADPLKDIRNTQRIAGVMANGKWWDRSDLDAYCEMLPVMPERSAAQSPPDDLVARPVDDIANFSCLMRAQQIDSAAHQGSFCLGTFLVIRRH
jgi:adenine deaminase